MIAAQLLTNPGDGLLFEDPGPFIARHLFESLGRRLVHAPVDAEGMDFEATVAKDRQIRLAFAMPSRQIMTSGKSARLFERYKNSKMSCHNFMMYQKLDYI